MKTLITLVIGCFSLMSYPSFAQQTEDPLPSWNNTKTKHDIIEFVEQVTTTTSEHFIPISDRIATFDNDGTLWSEKPVYFQFYYIVDSIKQQAPQHPEWKTQEPFASVLKGDMDALKQAGMQGLMTLIAQTHAGMTTEAFEQSVATWLATAKHPTTGRAYTEMVYQPMLELLNYLRSHDFKTYIVSGGGVDFMRVWAPKAYGIPKEQILGSSMKTQFELHDGKARIVRLPEINVNNDKAQKPLTIHNVIGKKPVMAVGNSDGDLAMLQWTASSDTPNFPLLIHHTDAQREWAYDKDSAVGRLEHALIEARKSQWTIVDMKKEWKQIYPK